jgi:hypothetical protein
MVKDEDGTVIVSLYDEPTTDEIKKDKKAHSTDSQSTESEK